MEKIKLFLYLDYEKVTSLYSQINGGLIESFFNKDKTVSSNSEQQKGPFRSGATLADTSENTQEIIEKKLLHDYIYNLFENEMIKNEKVLQINENTTTSEIHPLKLIKVQGKATLLDSEVILNLLENFNSLGEAFAYMNSFQDILFNKMKPNDKKKALLEFQKNQNLFFEDDFIKSMKRILIQSYKNSFKLEISLNGIRYTAILNRENLKESENLLIGKLSRNTEAKITLFGVTTQTANKVTTETKTIDSDSFKELTRDLIHSISGMEELFEGKSDSEIIIDPFAVYLELDF